MALTAPSSRRRSSAIFVGLGLLVAVARPAFAQRQDQVPGFVTLRDGREFATLPAFSVAAQTVLTDPRDGSRLATKPFDDSIAGYFDALNAFLLTNASGVSLAAFDDFARAGASAVDRIPIPSGSTSVAYRFDETLETFVRTPMPLAPAISQNARTNGQGILSIGYSYSQISYQKFDSFDRSGVVFSAFRPGVRPIDPASGVGIDFVGFLDFDLDQDVHAASLSYGVLPDLDVGVFIPVFDVEFTGRTNARFFGVLPDGRYVPAVLQNGQINPDPDNKTIYPERGEIDRSAFTGGFLKSVFGLQHHVSDWGIGDVSVRAKYFVGTFGPLDAGTSLAITTPTGNEDDLLGQDAWRFDPRVLLSWSMENVSAHANLGYHADADDQDRDRFDYFVGAEGRVNDWITVLIDHVGRMEVRGTSKIQAFDVVPGVKVNVWRDVVVGFNAILSLNEEGLTDDFVPNFVLEGSFPL